MTKNEPRRISFTIRHCLKIESVRSKFEAVVNFIAKLQYKSRACTIHHTCSCIFRYSKIQQRQTDHLSYPNCNAYRQRSMNRDRDVPYNRGAPDQISRTLRPPHSATCHINYDISVPSPPIPTSASFLYPDPADTPWDPHYIHHVSLHVAPTEWWACSFLGLYCPVVFAFPFLCILKLLYVGSARHMAFN